MERTEKQLGKILIDKGLIRLEQLDDALAEQSRTKKFLGHILLKKRYIEEKDLLGALSEQFNIPVGSIKDKYINWDFVKKFSLSLILEHKCLPIQKDNISVTVAISNPLDVWMLKELEEETAGFKLKFILISEREMEKVLEIGKKHLQ